MAGITLAQAQEQLNTYLAAEIAVLANQSYKIGNREFRRADLEAVQMGVKTWNDRVVQLAASARGRGRSRTVVVGG